MATIKVAPVKPNISIDLLERVDIRVDTNKPVEGVKGYRDPRFWKPQGLVY